MSLNKLRITLSTSLWGESQFYFFRCLAKLLGCLNCPMFMEYAANYLYILKQMCQEHHVLYIQDHTVPSEHLSYDVCEKAEVLILF